MGDMLLLVLPPQDTLVTELLPHTTMLDKFTQLLNHTFTSKSQLNHTSTKKSLPNHTSMKKSLPNHTSTLKYQLNHTSTSNQKLPHFLLLLQLLTVDSLGPVLSTVLLLMPFGN